MKFESNENFAYIKEMVAKGDYAVYDSFWKDTYEDVEILIRELSGGINQDNLQEISQSVMVKVISSLPDFCEKSENNTPNMGNSFLATIVGNEARSYFRKWNKLNGPNRVDYDDTLMQDFASDISEATEHRELLFDALKDVLQINTTSDKMLAFIYGRLLGRLSGKMVRPNSLSKLLKMCHCLRCIIR